MILAFKPQFKDKILNGSKIHTIREDKLNRWKPGNSIHMATGVRTKNYNQFAERLCMAVEPFEIFYYPLGTQTTALVVVNDMILGKAIWVNCKLTYSNPYLNLLATNDGFASINEFFEWFDSDFKGKIIHWTDFKY